MQGGKITVVVGGQYGSEAKGTVVGHIARTENVNVAVRTGAINAGHTVPYEGKFYAMQMLPCAWVNPNVQLVIGRGAYIDFEILHHEIEIVEKAGVSIRDRLYLDPRAGTHLAEHGEAENQARMHERFGSTAHGCMEAQFARMRRHTNYELAGVFWDRTNNSSGGPAIRPPWTWVDTEKFLNSAYDDGAHILLEGTQGTELDLLHGTYPYVTSRPTIATHWLTEAGLAPSLNIEVVLVCRTYPIRVAGNSGPLPREISWPSLARRLNNTRHDFNMGVLVHEDALRAFEEAEEDLIVKFKLPNLPHLLTADERMIHSDALVRIHAEVFERLPEIVVQELRKFFEITTVTHKLRRIAEFDPDSIRKAIRLNRPRRIVLTFLNYLFPMVENLSESENDLLPTTVRAYIQRLQKDLNVPVCLLGINRNVLIRNL